MKCNPRVGTKDNPRVGTKDNPWVGVKGNPRVGPFLAKGWNPNGVYELLILSLL